MQTMCARTPRKSPKRSVSEEDAMKAIDSVKMTVRAALSAALVFGALTVVPAESGEVVEVSSVEELEKLLFMPAHALEIRLAPGEYHITPRTGVDQSCGNCQEPDTLVP